MSVDFTWAAEHGGSGKDVTPRVSVVRLGDGYVQRVGQGMRKTDDAYRLKFERPVAEIDAIEAFLEAHADGAAFTFADPRSGATVRVMCIEKWSRDYLKAGWDVLACKFERTPA